MKNLTTALLIGVTVTVAAACNKAASPTTPSPTPVVTPAVPAAPLGPVLTLAPDTATPVGEAAAITFASRAQEPGKIAIAVTGFNLQNQLSPTVFGVSSVTGQLRVDDTLLEFDAAGIGDLMGGNDGGGQCTANLPAPQGTYPFCVGRRDGARVTGSGELLLFRFKPRAGVTTGTTRIELVPFLVDVGGGFTFMTPLRLSPFGTSGNKIQNAYGATITIRPGS